MSQMYHIYCDLAPRNRKDRRCIFWRTCQIHTKPLKIFNSSNFGGIGFLQISDISKVQWRACLQTLVSWQGLGKPNVNTETYMSQMLTTTLRRMWWPIAKGILHKNRDKGKWRIYHHSITWFCVILWSCLTNWSREDREARIVKTKW